MSSAPSHPHRPHPHRPAAARKPGPVNRWPHSRKKPEALRCDYFRIDIGARVPGSWHQPERARPEHIRDTIANIAAQCGHAHVVEAASFFIRCGLRAPPAAFAAQIVNWAQTCYEADEAALDKMGKVWLRDIRALRELAQLWKDQGHVTWVNGCVGPRYAHDPVLEDTHAADFWDEIVAPRLRKLQAEAGGAAAPQVDVPAPKRPGRSSARPGSHPKPPRSGARPAS